MAKKEGTLLDVFNDLNERISSLFENVEKPFANVTLSSKKTIINIDLPDKIKKKNLDLDIDKGSVVVKAETGKQNTKSHRVYYREIELPSGLDIKRARKRFSKGSLTIEIPRQKKKRR